MRSLAIALILVATPAVAQLAYLDPGTAVQIQANQIQLQQQLRQMQVQQNLQNQQLQIQFQLQQQQQQMQREVQYGAQRLPALHNDPGIAGPRYVVSRRSAPSAQERRTVRRLGKPQRPKRRSGRRR